MARPKGSTNKPKGTTNIKVLELSKDIKGAAVTRENTAYGFVNYGSRNDYPLQLLSLYNESPTHHAAINFGVQAIIGNGVDYEAMGLDGSQVFPNYQYSYDELIKNMALDYMIYGSYAVQIIKNKDNKTFSFWNIDLSKVRWTPYDEDGQITKYFISNDWKNVGQNPPIEIDAFDMREETTIERGKPYLYVYRPYTPTMDYYTSPHYIAAIKAIQAEIEYLNYDLKTTMNSFVPSGMLVLNDVETDEERRAVIQNVTNMFQGSDNANSVMIAFRNNIEEQAPSFIPFQASSTNVNLFDSANERTINRILAAHQIPNASLIGMPDVNGSGFASEADKLETAFQLYQKVCGNTNRMAVIGSLNNMFKLNGIDVEVKMKPLRFNDFGADDDKANDNDAPTQTQDTTTDNIEEKVEE